MLVDRRRPTLAAGSLVLVLVLAAALLAPAAVSATTYVSDGFESGSLAGWTVAHGGTGTASAETQVVRSGAYAAHLAASATSGSYADIRRTVTPLRTATISLDVYVGSEGVAGYNTPIVRTWASDGRPEISLYRQNRTGGQVWLEYAGTYLKTTGVLPLATWARFDVSITVNGGSTSGVVVRQNGATTFATSAASIGNNWVQTLQLGNERAGEYLDLYADNVTLSDSASAVPSPTPSPTASPTPLPTASPTPSPTPGTTPGPTPSPTPPPAGAVTFAIFGDSASASSATYAVQRQLVAHASEYSFLLHDGDSTAPATSYGAYSTQVWGVYGGLFQGQARVPGSPTTGTPKPLYATPGNHDYEYNGATYFRQSFFTGSYNGPAVGGVFYSKDIAGIHVVMFDSHWITGGWGDTYVRNVTAADVAAVTNWLVADLDAHRGQVTVVVEHEPGYPISSQHPYSENDCMKMRTYWYPIFAAHGVDLVVAGHDHAYQRQDPGVTGLHSYVAPSAGQALYSYTPGSWTRAWSSTPGFLEVTVTGTRIQTRDVQQDGTVYDAYAYDAVP